MSKRRIDLPQNYGARGGGGGRCRIFLTVFVFEKGKGSEPVVIEPSLGRRLIFCTARISTNIAKVN